jgi:hypothetical protein
LPVLVLVLVLVLPLLLCADTLTATCWGEVDTFPALQTKL